jgi:hypothetical protein
MADEAVAAVVCDRHRGIDHPRVRRPFLTDVTEGRAHETNRHGSG